MIRGFGDEIVGSLEELRKHAESLMRDRCKVERIVSYLEDDFGRLTPVFAKVYEGRAKSQTYEAHETEVRTGHFTATKQRYAIHFPAVIQGFKPEVGDKVTWLSSEQNPSLIGRHERIAAPFEKSVATSQRVYSDDWQELSDGQS